MACEESCYDLLKLVYRLGSSSPSLRSAKLLRAPLALSFVGTLRIRRLSIRLVRNIDYQSFQIEKSTIIQSFHVLANLFVPIQSLSIH